MKNQPAFEQEIKELLLLSERDLLLRIGEEILPPSMGLFNDPVDKIVHAGRNWYNENTQKLQEKVCGSDSLRHYLTDADKFDKVIVVSSVADLILNTISGVSPIVVAVLIVKEGIKAFCKNYSHEANPAV